MLGFHSDRKLSPRASVAPNRWLAAGAGLLMLIDAAACGGSGSKPASRDTLTAIKATGGVHFLAKGQDCPEGGEPFKVPSQPNAYLIAVDQENPADPNSPTYAVLAQNTYKDIGAVVCGPDGGPQFGGIGERFKGNAVMAIQDTTMLVAVSLQK